MPYEPNELNLAHRYSSLGLAITVKKKNNR